MKFKKLSIYEEAMRILAETYKITKLLPKEEIYNLCSQMNRSALSIPSNIAEGSGKNSDADFGRFISISNGSCSELYCQLEAVNMLYPDLSEKVSPLLLRVEHFSIMLNKFHRALKR